MSPLIIGVLVIAVIYFIFQWGRPLVQFIHSMRVYNRIPAPEGEQFFLGHAPLLSRDACEFYKQMHHYSQQFHDQGLFRIRIGLHRMVACFTPESAEKLLSTTKHLNKATFYELLHSWIGRGLLTADAERWRPRRKLLTHAFHFGILQDFVPLLNEHANTLLSVLEEQRVKHVSGISIYPLITRCALDIISDSAMGVKINAQRNPSCDYVQSILCLSEMAVNRMKSPFQFNETLFGMLSVGRVYNDHVKSVHAFTDDVIRKRKEAFLSLRKHRAVDKEGPDSTSFTSSRTRLAFLDLLLNYQFEQQQTGKEMLSDLDIREEVDTFMFEGHDTTAAGMTWTLYLLATHPQVQQKLQEELDTVLEMDEHGKLCPITTDQISRLQYLDMVVKEALRIFPPVPLIGRVCEEDMTLGGYQIEKGVDLVFLITSLHRREELFPNATEFRPERFDRNSEDAQEVSSAFTYTPFSAGARNCIGSKFAQLEEKVILASILHQYSLSCQQSVEDVAPKLDIILRPGKDVMLKLALRHGQLE